MMHNQISAIHIYIPTPNHPDLKIRQELFKCIIKIWNAHIQILKNTRIQIHDLIQDSPHYIYIKKKKH